MIQQQFTFDEFHFSSQLIRDLVAENKSIAPFISAEFSLENIQLQADKKQFSSAQRSVLVEQLIQQNAQIPLTIATKANIDSILNDNTYTITTGHQLNVMTGPLYSIYKVAQIIGLTQGMNERDPSRKYVPVFWMATEDHDFEEINHIHLFGNKIAFEKTGQNDRIAGAIEPIGFEKVSEEILQLYRDEAQQDRVRQLTSIYETSENLAEATRRIMNMLFGEFGLVILDGNDAELKKSFAPIAAKEIEEEFVFKAVSSVNEQLDKAGYHQQVYVRNCNLFYIDEDQTRIRISFENNTFSIGEKAIPKNELLDLIRQNPAQFSPNALLRPVYQELILPNLVYVGGGGEIAYWMQLKGVFDALSLAFPLLRVRDSFVLLRQREIAELEQLELSLVDLKREQHELVKELALEEVEVEIELHEERSRLVKIKDDLVEKSTKIDPGMKGLIEAEFVKMDKSIERIESKFIKAEKAKHEQKAAKIAKLKSKIYPNGGFQERYENFLPYFLADPQFVSKIVNNLKAADSPRIEILEI